MEQPVPEMGSALEMVLVPEAALTADRPPGASVRKSVLGNV